MESNVADLPRKNNCEIGLITNYKLRITGGKKGEDNYELKNYKLQV